MYGKDKSYKLYTVLGWPVATLIIVFTAGLLLWMYGESIEAINNENLLGMEQRHTAIDFVLANNIANIEQGLREVRDTTPLVNAIIRDDKHDAKDILIQLTDVMQNPPLDVVFIQLWDGKLFTEVTSPFFNLAESIDTLGNAVTPSLDNGGLLSVNGLSILAASEPLLKKDTGRVVGRIVGGTVLNDNLAILDTIHQLTKSEIVVLTNDGEIISSTAPQSSKTVQRLAKKRYDGQRTLKIILIPTSVPV